jgi:hypothetical protein
MCSPKKKGEINNNPYSYQFSKLTCHRVVKSLVLGKRDSTYKLFIENLKPRW